MLPTVPQSKLLKWWQIVRNLQMKSASSAQDAEVSTSDEQKALENSYIALNGLLGDIKSVEEKNLELQEELNNLRQKIDRDKKEFARYAISEFASDMISVADNIRRAIETVQKEQLGAVPALNSLVEGFEVTERSLLTALNRHQITRFDPTGEPFNPHLHEAKATVSAPDLPANTVVQVLHAGYIMEERLLRPAGVVVSQASASAPQSAAQYSADSPAPPALSGVNGSGPLTLQAGTLERSSSVLHKPVITGTEGIPAAARQIFAAPDDKLNRVPEYSRIYNGQPSLRESLAALRHWDDDPSGTIYTSGRSGRNEPLLSDQEASYEPAEISLPSDPAMAVEDVQEDARAVNDAFEAKNYAEAARLQERLAAVVRLAETAAEGKPGDGTLDALLSLSWYQLCAGEYDAVIATADQADAIRKDYISIDTNRAHALMLKGSTDDARLIYGKHRGKVTRNKKTWEREVLDDFAELDLANIKHPLMDEIRNDWAESH